MRSHVFASILSIAAVVVACGPTPPPPPANAGGSSGAPTKCDLAGRALTEPDLVGWDSNARGLLNSQRRYGAIAVHFEAKGCDVQLEVLTRCIAPAMKYDYTPYFASEKKVAHDQNELFAKIPIGAASLAGAMKQGESLRADTANVGVASLPPDATFKLADLKGPECARATHVIGRLYLGAFAMASGETRDIDAAATVFGVGAGGRSSSLKSIGREEGDLAECDKAKADGKEHASCAVPLRLGLVPLLDVTAAVGAGGATTGFTFDDVKLGDPLSRFAVRPSFQRACVKHQSGDGRDVYGWLPRDCYEHTFPEGSAVFAFGPHEQPGMPVETIMVVGGTYFDSHSNFPLHVGDPPEKASGVFGAPKKTFELPEVKDVKVQIHRDDVAVVIYEGKVFGYAVGKFQDAPGPKTIWHELEQALNEERNHLIASKKSRRDLAQSDPSSAEGAEALKRYTEQERAEILSALSTLNQSRANLCASLSAACKAKDAPIRDCEVELRRRYEMELKMKCLRRSQAWVECMAKNTSKIAGCVPLKVSGCEEEEEAVRKCK